MHPFYVRLLRKPSSSEQYTAWLASHRRNDAWLGRQIAPEADGISFSLILPTKAPNFEWLRMAVESVRSQTWPNWQLCISTDGKMVPLVSRWLDDLAHEDRRIVVVHASQSGISAALNLGVAAAVGEYVAFIDHDDLLEPTALAHVAERLSAGAADLIYTDEDYIDPSGQPVCSNFKPGWSPELLLACMYMGHLIVARRDHVLNVGGFDPHMDGAQDFDLVLKLVDSGARVDHIARVLYHWRSHEGSTALSATAKPYTQVAGKNAIAASLRRRHADAEVAFGSRPNTYRVHYHPAKRTITLVIASRNPAALRRCLQAVRDKTGIRDDLQMVVVHHQTKPAANAAMRTLIRDFGATEIPFGGPFHFARMMNQSVRTADGDLLIFLRDEVEPAQPDWLVNLTSSLGRADIGVTGARLLNPDGSIHHAGIIVGVGEGPGRSGRSLCDSSWWPWVDHTRDVAAVTGACLATTRELFRTLGGFDECFPSDIDYCLRSRRAGFRVVIQNDAVLIIQKRRSEVGKVALSERETFLKRWGELIETPDRFFTTHLTADDENLTLRPGY